MMGDSSTCSPSDSCRPATSEAVDVIEHIESASENYRSAGKIAREDFMLDSRDSLEMAKVVASDHGTGNIIIDGR